MKTWTKYLTVLALMGMIGTVRAADDAEAKAQKKAEKQASKQVDKEAAKQAKAAAKKPILQGQVVKVDGNTLTLTTGKKGAEKEMSVTADAKTLVMIEGKTAKLADLQPGAKVQIMGDATAGTATRIVVPAAKVKKPKVENADKAADNAVEKK